MYGRVVKGKAPILDKIQVNPACSDAVSFMTEAQTLSLVQYNILIDNLNINGAKGGPFVIFGFDKSHFARIEWQARHFFGVVDWAVKRNAPELSDLIRIVALDFGGRY